jgi:hypothetical protein
MCSESCPASVGIFKVLSKSEPSVAFVISAIVYSNLVSVFASNFGDGVGSFGQKDKKSPPGPNLHTGSACFCG